MRDSLTVLAGLLILALTAALAAPFFIDWNGYRADVEQRLTQALGAPTSIGGSIDLRLLPTPTLNLEKIAIGKPDGPRASVQSAHVEVAVMPLLRGQIEIIEATLERPHFELALDAPVATKDAQAPAVRIERILLRDAQFDLRAGDKALRLEHIDVDARAASLAGPFKGEGAITQEGERTPFRFSTAEREGDRLRLKFVVESISGRPRIELDGALIAGGRFEGRTIVASRLGETPWRIAGDVEANATGARFAKIDARLGEEETIASADGEGDISFAEEPRLRLRLAARQLDLDRLAAQTGLADALASTQARRLSVAIEAQAEAATAAGETLTGLTARLALAPKTPMQVEFGGLAPGRSRVNFSLAPGEGGPHGRIALQSEDWPRFAQWAAKLAPQAAGALNSLPARDVALAADYAARADGFALDNLNLSVAKTAYAGRVVFRPPSTGRRAFVQAELDAPALDLDALPDFSTFEAGDVDLALKFDARALRMARPGQAAVSAGHIGVTMARDAGGLRIDRLKLDDVAGAQIEARANIGRAGGHIEFKGEARDFRAPADILRRLAPGGWSDELAARAGALSPMRVTGAAEILRIGDSLAPVRFALEGEAGGARLSGATKPIADGRMQSSLVIDAKDGAALLTQLGLPAFDALGLGPGRLVAESIGRIGEPAQTKIETRIADTNVVFDGALNLDLAHPAADGRLTLASLDIAPLLRAFALDFPDLTATTPAKGAARVLYRDGRWRLENLDADIAGARAQGALERNPGGRLDGSIKLGRLSLPWLFGLTLGPPQPARAGALWSDLRFPPDAAAPPDATLDIEAATLDIGPDLAGANARMKLDIAPGRLTLTQVQTEIAGGRLEGRLSLRRDGADANLAGQVQATGVNLELPSLKGRGTFALDFAGAGASASTLVSSLSGTGKGEALDMRLPRSDPMALLRIVEAVENERLAIDEQSLAAALSRQLDLGELRLSVAPLDVSLLNGVLKIASAGPSGFGAALDLRNLAIDQRVRLAPPQAAFGWKGGLPSIETHIVGPARAPMRTIDTAALSQALVARAIAREQARIEAFEFDIRERAFFYRRLKSERARDEAKRQAEEVARLRALAEAARMKSEEDARREAEAIMRPSAQPSLTPPPSLPPPATQKRLPRAPAPGELY